MAKLKDPLIIKFTDFMWENKNNKLSLESIQSSKQFNELCEKFSCFKELINECVKDMIVDLANYKHQYKIINNRICYSEQDSISSKIVYGYKTMFSYYHEFEQKMALI